MPGSAFWEHMETLTLKILPAGTNHEGAFMGLMYVPVCLKNSGYVTAVGTLEATIFREIQDSIPFHMFLALFQFVLKYLS